MGKTPTELIQEARYEQKNFDWMDERQLPHYFDKFIEYINEKGFTEYSQKMMIISVKAFYHCFEITTPKKGVSGVPKSYYLMYEDLPQYEDIRKLISLSNIQYTALFSHMASSGMNYSDATSISVEELLKAVNFYFRIIKNEIRVHALDDLYQLQEKSEVIIPAWRMWRFKTSNQHITFSSPESLNNILDYFEENPPADLKVPVFRSNRSQKILGYNSVRHYLGEMNEKLGWADKKVGTFKYITSKSFRTFFLNELEDEDLNYRTIRLMMGHKMPGVDQNYSKKKAAKFLKTYKKGLNRLTFAEKPVLIQGDNDEEIKAMKEELNKRAEADKEKDEIIKQLRSDVNRALQLKGMESDLSRK